MALDSRLRSALTLGTLAVVLLVGMVWAWSAVTEPFPEAEETPPCTVQSFAAGDVLRTRDVLVNVMNAGSREGLARTTMDQLIRHGFGAGVRDNTTVPKGTPAAQVWAADAEDPAARLVLRFLGDAAEIVEQQTAAEGVTVVVGDEFPGVVDGRGSIKVQEPTRVCTPYDPRIDE